MSNEVNPVSLQDVLSARASAHDRQERERLLTRIVPKIRQVIRAVVSNHGHAEDIDQSAVEEVLKNLHSFRGIGTLEAWAGKIAFRTAVRYMGKRREWDNLHTMMDETLNSQGPCPERILAKRETFLCLEKHLLEIPAIRRTPLLLHLVYGYTVEEVSAMVGAPKNTVKDRLKTAVRELRTIMDRNPGLKQAMLEVVS
jgi:RNA polymerase sigma-70 factor (ECF subfamily)